MDVTISPRFVRCVFSVIAICLVGSPLVEAKSGSSSAVFVTDSVPQKVKQKPRRSAQAAVKFFAKPLPARKQATWAQGQTPPPLAQPDSAEFQPQTKVRDLPETNSQAVSEQVVRERDNRKPKERMLRSPIALAQHLESQRSPAVSRAPLPVHTAGLEVVEQGERRSQAEGDSPAVQPCFQPKDSTG